MWVAGSAGLLVTVPEERAPASVTKGLRLRLPEPHTIDGMSTQQPRPADAILFERGVLTRVRPQDAAEMIAAVTANAEQLRAWIPWADDPEARRAKVEGADADWEADRAYVYALRETPVGPVIGGIGAYRRVGPGAIELGYWLASDHVGRGLATAGTAALATVVRALPDVERIELHIDEANTRSADVARRLGFQLARTDAYEPRTAAETGRLQIWVRAARPEPGSPSA